MNRQLPPRANAIAHIDDIFAGASLATFAEEKLTEVCLQPSVTRPPSRALRLPCKNLPVQRSFPPVRMP